MCDRRARRARAGNTPGAVSIVGDDRANGSAGGCDRRAARRPALVALIPPGAARSCRTDHAAASEPAADLFGRIRRDERAVGLPHRKLLRAWSILMRPG